MIGDTKKKKIASGVTCTLIGDTKKKKIASGVTCASTATKPNQYRLTPHAGTKRIIRRKQTAADQDRELKREKRNTQQQKKKKKNAAAAAEDDDGDHHHRDWSVLPDPILHSVLSRLFLSVDSSAPSTFSSVCTSWRSFFASSKQCIVSALPPFLLRPRWAAPPRPIIIPEVPKKRPPVREPFFDVLSVFSTAFPQSKSQLRNDRLANSYVCGFSHGYIITMDGRTNRPVLTDPFTGKDLWLFPLPPPHHWPNGPPRKIEIAILTAAPYSKNCRIVLHCPKMSETLWICKAGSSEWSFRRFSLDFCVPSQLIHHRHNVYAVTSAGTIIIMDLLSDHLPIIEFLPEGCPRISIFDVDVNIGPFITEFNGQVLFILCAPLNPANPSKTFRVQVYQLSERRLVRTESIGNCALFIDSEGLVMACANPGRVGGAKKNHIYLTGPGCESWKEVSVGGLVDLPGFVAMDMWKRWPRPLWVLPPSCY